MHCSGVVVAASRERTMDGWAQISLPSERASCSGIFRRGDHSIRPTSKVETDQRRQKERRKEWPNIFAPAARKYLAAPLPSCLPSFNSSIMGVVGWMLKDENKNANSLFSSWERSRIGSRRYVAIQHLRSCRSELSPKGRYPFETRDLLSARCLRSLIRG